LIEAFSEQAVIVHYPLKLSTKRVYDRSRITRPTFQEYLAQWHKALNICAASTKPACNLSRKVAQAIFAFAGNILNPLTKKTPSSLATIKGA